VGPGDRREHWLVISPAANFEPGLHGGQRLLVLVESDGLGELGGAAEDLDGGVEVTELDVTPSQDYQGRKSPSYPSQTNARSRSPLRDVSSIDAVRCSISLQVKWATMN
jgi:hypothetical protein